MRIDLRGLSSLELFVDDNKPTSKIGFAIANIAFMGFALLALIAIALEFFRHPSAECVLVTAIGGFVLTSIANLLVGMKAQALNILFAAVAVIGFFMAMRID